MDQVNSHHPGGDHPAHKRQLPCTMINTSTVQQHLASNSHTDYRRPSDTLFQEEAILALTDSEYTSFDSLNGVSKRRKIAVDYQSQKEQLREVRLGASSKSGGVSLLVPNSDYLSLRHKLVDSVANAMQLDFQSLALPVCNAAAGGFSPCQYSSQVMSSLEEQLMLKRTFFRAHHSEEEPRGASLSIDSLKLLNHEFYLVRQSESGSGVATASQSDETLSSSSTVLSATDQQQQHQVVHQATSGGGGAPQLQHSAAAEDFLDQAYGSIGSIYKTRQPLVLEPAKLAEFFENLEVQTRAYLQARSRLTNK